MSQRVDGISFSCKFIKLVLLSSLSCWWRKQNEKKDSGNSMWILIIHRLLFFKNKVYDFLIHSTCFTFWILISLGWYAMHMCDNAIKFYLFWQSNEWQFFLIEVDSESTAVVHSGIASHFHFHFLPLNKIKIDKKNFISFFFVSSLPFVYIFNASTK